MTVAQALAALERPPLLQWCPGCQRATASTYARRWGPDVVCAECRPASGTRTGTRTRP